MNPTEPFTFVVPHTWKWRRDELTQQPTQPPLIKPYLD